MMMNIPAYGEGDVLSPGLDLTAPGILLVSEVRWEIGKVKSLSLVLNELGS